MDNAAPAVGGIGSVESCWGRLSETERHLYSLKEEIYSKEFLFFEFRLENDVFGSLQLFCHYSLKTTLVSCPATLLHGCLTFSCALITMWSTSEGFCAINIETSGTLRLKHVMLVGQKNLLLALNYVTVH